MDILVSYVMPASLGMLAHSIAYIFFADQRLLNTRSGIHPASAKSCVLFLLIVE